MSIESEEDLQGLKEAGRITRLILEAMKAAVAPGVSTAELDAIGAEVGRVHGARSAPMLVYNFPGYNCISLNDEAVHGIPGPRRLKAADVVKLDVTIELDGYMADAAETVIVPPAPPGAEHLAECTKRAFRQGMQQARAGARIWEIGRAVEMEVRASGFAVIRELSGHGIGRKIHEPPTVPNYRDTTVRGKLTEGLVLTIEPIIAQGSGACFGQDDGWTVATSDGSLSAHYEHTLVITKDVPIVLTA